MSTASTTLDRARELSNTSTPVKIAKYTVASSLVGGLITAAYESTRGHAKGKRVYEAEQASMGRSRTALGSSPVHPYRHPVGLLAGSAALNSGIVAFCFFSLREYLVSPTLGAYKRYTSDDGEAPSSQAEDQRSLTWSTLRFRNVPDTAITSAVLGASYNAWMRGPVGVPAGAITASLMCTLVQLAVNEAHVLRVRYVSSHSNPHSRLPSEPTTNSPPEARTLSVESALTSPPTSPVPRSPTLALPHEQSMSSSSSGSTNEPKSLSERLLALVGVTKMSDEEYLERLRKRRDGYLKRIEELEEQERRRKDGDDS